MKRKEEAEVEDTGTCVCGHPYEKHRDRGRHSCKKCKCTEYVPGLNVDGLMVPAPHEAGCRCAGCVWERLENAERNLLKLRDRMDELQEQVDGQKDYINNVLFPSKQMVDNIVTTIANTKEAQRVKTELEKTVADALVKKAEKEAKQPKTVTVPNKATKSISEQLKDSGGKIDRSEKPVQPKVQTPPITP